MIYLLAGVSADKHITQLHSTTILIWNGEKDMKHKNDNKYNVMITWYIANK